MSRCLNGFLNIKILLVTNMEGEFQETIKQFRRRYEQEYDTFVNTGIKINDNLLLINSAIIAVLIVSNGAVIFKYSIFFFFLSATSSLLSLFKQKELSRTSSIKFLTAAIEAEKSDNEGVNLSNLPSTEDLRRESGYISTSLNIALLSFFVASVLVLINVFCSL